MTAHSRAISALRRVDLGSCLLLGGLVSACAVGTQAGPPDHFNAPAATATPTPTPTVPATAAYPALPAPLPSPLRPSPVLGEYSIHLRPAQGTVTIERLGPPAPGDGAALVDLGVSGLLAAGACPAGFQVSTICFEASLAHSFPRSLSHVALQVTAITDPTTGLALGNHGGINGDPSEQGLDAAKGFWQLTAPASTTPGVVGQSPFNSASRELVFANDDGADVDLRVRVLSSLAYGSYLLDYSSQAFVDACDGGEILAASPSAKLPLPFPFTLYGTTSSAARIGLPGVISFKDGKASMSGDNLALPSKSAPWPAIFPFWDDLGYPPSGGAVCARTLGSAPGRQVVITWKNLDFLGSADQGGHLTFSAMLSEGSDRIDMVYDDMTGPTDRASGGSATVGVQDIAGFAATSEFQLPDFGTGNAYALVPIP